MRLQEKQTRMRMAEFGIQLASKQEAIASQNRIYLGITQDRRNGTPIIGTCNLAENEDWTQTAYNKPDSLIYEPINPFLGLHIYQARNLASGLNLAYEQWGSFNQFATNLAACYLASDALFAELVLAIPANTDQLVPLQVNMTIDDNALFRQPKFKPTINSVYQPPTSNGMNYVKLDGQIGCLSNGAGLAMATIDMISVYAEAPYQAGSMVDFSNELREENIQEGVRVTLANSQIRCLIFNLFTAPTNGRDIASYLLLVLENLQIPTIIRLNGLYSVDGLTIIQTANLPHVIGTNLLADAAQRAIRAAQGTASWRS